MKPAMRPRTHIAIASAALFALAVSCNSMQESDAIPSVSMPEVSRTTSTGAVLSAIVTQPEKVLEAGFVVGDSLQVRAAQNGDALLLQAKEAQYGTALLQAKGAQNGTALLQQVVGSLDGDGLLQYEIEGLSPSTDYCAFAYISNGVNRITSEAVAFRTEDQFPDKALREYILGEYDKDGNGLITEDEVAVVRELTVPPKVMENVGAAEGIEVFSNVRRLSLEGYWDITTGLKRLDLSKMTRLEDINLGWGQITELILPSGIRKIDCLGIDYNPLPEIDFKDIEEATLLQLNYACLKSLDLSRFTRIDQLSVIGNDLEVLDLSSVTTMGCLLCRENPRLSLVKINSKCNIHQLEVESWTKVEYVDQQTGE